MKIFLASSGDKTFHLLKEQMPNIGNKVVFVANAADPYTIYTFWIDWDRNKLKELGYELQELDLRGTTPDQLKTILEANDILHICGGSVYYILTLIREKQLVDVIVGAIQNETVVYTGTSAGSIILSQNIKAFSYDEEEAEHIKKIPDHKGLGVLNFGIVPHSNQTDFVKEHQKMVEEMPNDPTALFYIQDRQALWIDDEKMKLLEANL